MSTDFCGLLAKLMNNSGKVMVICTSIYGLVRALGTIKLTLPLPDNYLESDIQIKQCENMINSFKNPDRFSWICFWSGLIACICGNWLRTGNSIFNQITLE